MLFKKRALQVRIVKTNNPTPKATEPTAEYTTSQLEAIQKMVTRDNVKFAVIATLSIVATVVVLRTASEIAINASPKN